MGKPPTPPYPPDPDPESEAPTALGDLLDAAVEGADWANERARGASLRRVELVRCRLTGAELAESTLADVVFDDCRLDLAGFRFARLERVVFRDCRLEEAELHGATLTDVLFERCSLREASLADAKLTRVELRACDLTALAGGEALRGARIPWSDAVDHAPLFAALAGVELVE